VPDWLVEELHDEVAQALWYLTLELSSLSQEIPEDRAGFQDLQQRVKLLEDVAQEGYQHLRVTMGWAKASDTPCRCLAEVIEDKVGVFERKTGVGAKLHLAPGRRVSVSPQVAHQVAAVLQEAMWNAWRHGDAGLITVRVDTDKRRVRVTVEDDGRGFAVQQHLDGHYGLATMQKRARDIDGDLEVESAPGRGTRVTLTFPAGTQDVLIDAGPIN
jgi:signal transduction histidine kinase